jgi:hypothetical protein
LESKGGIFGHLGLGCVPEGISPPVVGRWDFFFFSSLLVQSSPCFSVAAVARCRAVARGVSMLHFFIATAVCCCLLAASLSCHLHVASPHLLRLPPTERPFVCPHSQGRWSPASSTPPNLFYHQEIGSGSWLPFDSCVSSDLDWRPRLLQSVLAGFGFFFYPLRRSS